MRGMRLIRDKAKISLKTLSIKTNISYSHLCNFENENKDLSVKSLKKISKFLNCNIEDLTKSINYKGKIYLPQKETVKEKINYNTKCLNQACPLNQDCICINDTVLTGKAPCYGKDRVKDKAKYKKMNSTNYLFRI